VDGPGEEFLAGAGFAGDERVGVGVGGLGHEVQAGRDPGAVADDTLALERHRGRAMREFFLAVLERPDERQGHGVGRGRLFDVVPGAVLNGQLGAVGVARTGENDDLGGLVAFGDGGDGQQTVAVG